MSWAWFETVQEAPLIRWWRFRDDVHLRSMDTFHYLSHLTQPTNMIQRLGSVVSRHMRVFFIDDSLWKQCIFWGLITSICVNSVSLVSYRSDFICTVLHIHAYCKSFIFSRCNQSICTYWIFRHDSIWFHNISKFNLSATSDLCHYFLYQFMEENIITVSKAAAQQWCMYVLLMFPDRYTRALWGYVNKNTHCITA